MTERDARAVSEMVASLDAHQKNKGAPGFQCKKATYNVHGSQITVDSWKMMESEYKKPNLPTYARGLFTYRNSQSEQEIAIRGYDKFFNHNETRQTEWKNVEAHTKGPYELSVKENGCIIFMSGLEDGTLLICSKHSTGETQGAGLSHSEVGRQWVAKHLTAVGKSTTDLAHTLRDMNATAVAELCDDDFEEHVLAYTPSQAGLYLHGLNLNLPKFVTYPAESVDDFADAWGFKKVMHLRMDDIHAVKSFCEKVAETGHYDGRDTEGFVIRCKTRTSADQPWEDWFFKYKFEEPYLMYRQWRECTKAVISAKVPKFKKHKQITEEYLEYARRVLHANPKLGQAYNENHGIIKLREDFLAERGITGAEAVRGESLAQDAVARDVVLVPVATIGCGKTTVALALVKLFGWGHLQNDNIEGKQKPQRFAQGVCSQLLNHPVVVADRNNHQKRERKQILDDVAAIVPSARLVALHYVHDDRDAVRAQTRNRVLTRGDNHQTIHAGTKGQHEIISIMEGFLHRFEPIDSDLDPDSDFDSVIDLDVSASSRTNLETIIKKLHATYPTLVPSVPNSHELDEAIDAAMNEYKVTLKHEIKGSNKQRTPAQKASNWRDSSNAASNNSVKKQEPKVDYFAAELPSSSISTILESAFNPSGSAVSDADAAMYLSLKQNKRVQSSFHVTLIHQSGAKQHKAYWEQLVALDAQTKMSSAPNGSQKGRTELGKCRIVLENIVWDDRVMCIAVRLAGPSQSTSNTQHEEWKCVNDIAHITIGTADQSIKPKESNDLLRRWRSGESGPIRFLSVPNNVELEGSVRAVSQRYKH